MLFFFFASFFFNRHFAIVNDFVEWLTENEMEQYAKVIHILLFLCPVYVVVICVRIKKMVKTKQVKKRAS